MSDWPLLPTMPMLPIISTARLESMGGRILAQNFGSGSNAAWPSANRRIYVPFDMTETKKVAKLFAVNGTTATGNIDIGIFDATATKLICSTGSKVQTGTSQAQVIAPTTFPVLDPGRYYLCLVQSSGSSTNLRFSVSAALLRRGGCLELSSSFPLANATPGVITSTYLPHMGIVFDPRS